MSETRNTSVQSETKAARPWSLATLAVAVVLGVVLGVLMAQLLPELFEGSGPQTSASVTDEATDELWTCSMHPHVLEHGPGRCPICGMDLTPVKKATPDPLRLPSTDREIAYYRSAMEPEVTSPIPAKDAMGMDYVPVYAEELESGAGLSPLVEIDPLVVQNMNVRTERVARRDLTRPIRTVGYLEFDQQRMVTVTTKYSGWIEKVNVNYVGEKVRRGQPLFEIYSPELVQTEQELLSALDFAREMDDAPEDDRQRAWSMVESTRTRLGYWDVSAERIAQLEETGEVFRTLEVVAPSNGLVMKRLAGLEGMAVQPGMELFHIADMSSLWLSVEIFEDHLASVREGTRAEISLSYYPGETFSGRVRFLEPELSEETRTMRAKIEVPNRDGRMRKGMYATVELQPIEVRNALTVPLEAILRTGQRNVVVEALGSGRFQPRNVILGHEAEGFAEVKAGLSEQAEVVTSAQFLLDSESTLREAIQKMATRPSSRQREFSSEPSVDPVRDSGRR